MFIDRVSVLVLYTTSLLGEGLERLLAAEDGLQVRAVDLGRGDEVSRALGENPDVVVLEEGGRLDMLDVLRATTCPVFIDVSLDRTDVWTLRRDVIPSSPGDVIRRIRAACRASRADLTPAPRPARVLPLPG